MDFFHNCRYRLISLETNPFLLFQIKLICSDHLNLLDNFFYSEKKRRGYYGH